MHLKYVFLEENEVKPVVISSDLSLEEEARLMEVLKKNKEDIGWHISELKGISPAYCMHMIMMEEEYKPMRQLQRRLNPSMKEEVRKQVLKLLKAGLDSSTLFLLELSQDGGCALIIRSSMRL